jgi:hypothetical protein
MPNLHLPERQYRAELMVSGLRVVDVWRNPAFQKFRDGSQNEIKRSQLPWNKIIQSTKS